MTARGQKRALLGEGGDRLAWIFGSSRSGSTWLLRMLSRLDPVVPIDDPHLGHHLGVWRPIPLAWATAANDPELRTIADYKRDRRDFFFSNRYRERWIPPLRELIAARFEAQAEEEVGAGRVADPLVVVKEPASQVADLLVELFPRSRIVFLLRDCRDVIASWLDAYRDGSWATGEGAYPLSPEGRIAMIRWQAAVWLKRTEVVEGVFARLDPDRRVLVRYEQLRRDPVSALSRICPALGIAADRETIESTARANAYENLPAAQKGEGREIRLAQPGNWAQTMSASEIAAMHELLGPKLEEMGCDDPRGEAALGAARGIRAA